MVNTVLVDSEDTAYLLCEVEDLINTIDELVEHQDYVDDLVSDFDDPDVLYSAELLDSLDCDPFPLIMTEIILDNYDYERSGV
jgi:hypothetical protein